MGNERVQVPGGSRKKLQSKSGRKQQVSGSRPTEAHQHTVCREGSEDRNLESVVVRDLMAETLHWSVVVRDQPLGCGEGSDGREPLKSVVVRDKPLSCGEGSTSTPPWLLDPLLSSIFSCLRDIPECLSKSHVHTS